MKIGVRVFSIHHDDGKAKPLHYWLEEEGVVKRIKNTPEMKLVDWGKATHFDNGEKMFLMPNKQGFCYFMTELPDMDKYKDGNWYKVPTDILIKHMKSYKSPWI
jgi:hypothetical protein